MSILIVDSLRIELATARRRLIGVDAVSFTIRSGEVLGLVGESGAGKSLLAMSIMGLLEPPARIAGGRIFLDGARIDNLPEREMQRFRGRMIGTVVQEAQTSLNPLHRIDRQLVETLRAHDRLSPAAARARALECLRDVGIAAPEARLRAYPHELSGGTRQRVVIALATCANPRFIIADEPTTALDVSTQAQITALLRARAHRGDAGVLLVSHDIGMIAEVADRAAVMYAGRIVELGPVAEVVARPRHPYTAALMQAVPKVGLRAARMARIEGAMPALADISPACAFHPRCVHAVEHCRQQRPALTPVGESMVACWLYPAAPLDAALATASDAATPDSRCPS